MPHSAIEPSEPNMEVISTTRIGKIGETAVLHDLISNYPQFDVYLPLVDDKGIDIMVYTGSNYRRVQVKTLTKSRFATSIELKFKKHLKMNHEIDVLAVYFKPIDKIAYIPWKGKKTRSSETLRNAFDAR